MKRHGFLLMVPLLAMCIAQLIKVFLHRWKHKTWEWGLVFETGGTPSSHSALVTSLAVEMGAVYGFNSPWFTVTTIFALIVMYDAIGVRRQAGEQSLILKDLILHAQTVGLEVASSSASKLRHWQKKGHTPKEVLAGIVVGTVTAFLFTVDK